jgi:hypothetical protein
MCPSYVDAVKGWSAKWMPNVVRACGYIACSPRLGDAVKKRRLNMGDQQKGGSQSGQEQGGQQKDQNKQPQGSERSGDKNKQGDGQSQGEQKQGGRGGQKR